MHLGGAGGDGPGTQRFGHHEPGRIRVALHELLHLDGRHDFEDHIVASFAGKPGFQPDAAEEMMCQHVVDRQLVRDVKGLASEEIAIGRLEAAGLVAHEDAPVLVGQQDQPDRHPVAEEVHGNRRQYAGGVDRAGFQGGLHRIPAGHALGLELEGGGLKLAFGDEVFENTEHQVVRDLDVGGADADLAAGGHALGGRHGGGLRFLRPDPEGLFDFGFQLLLVEGLGHEAVDAGGERFLLLFLFPLAGRHQERHGTRGGIRPHPFHQLVSVHVGHIPVADDEIDGCTLFQDGRCRLAVHGFDDPFEAEALERLDFNFAHDRRIFDQQNRNLAGIQCHDVPSR